jgi:hypothetical protein
MAMVARAGEGVERGGRTRLEGRVHVWPRPFRSALPLCSTSTSVRIVQLERQLARKEDSGTASPAGQAA